MHLTRSAFHLIHAHTICLLSAISKLDLQPSPWIDYSLETFFPLVGGLAFVQTGCGVYSHRVSQQIAVTVLGSLLKSLQC
jgi:hypothetical protein